MNISAPFISRPIATSLLMAAVFLVGLVAFPMLPVAPLPQVDYPTILVTTNLPGASPETMASSVATPLENQFVQIPGVAQITSTSVLGTTQVTIQFELERNIDGAAQDVQAAINAASGLLPKILPSPPSFRKFNPADPAVITLSVHSDELPITTVDDFAENVILSRISQISGVGLVSIGGQKKPAIRIQVDPAKVASLGLQLEDIAAVITQATVNTPKGVITGPQRNFVIYNNDQITKAEPWNDVIIAYRNGAPIRVRDVGVAVEGPQDTQGAAWQNGKDGVMLQVYKQSGANIIDVVSRVEAAIPQIRASIPASLEIDKVIDRTKTIKASVEEVEFTLVLTTALVVLVIFLFLRNFWATVIPSITIPLALLGTCALMYLVGYTLDNLSLMALTIAVGFVVDDAIVMLENIYRHIEDGMDPLEAAYKGAGEIGFTILSISLSLVAVFIPLLLMGGIVGRLFREFAVTVTMTIAVSAIVSLTLTPMMCSRFIRHEASHGRFYKFTERFFDGMLAAYTRGLDFVLRHQFATLITFFVTLAATVALYVVVPKGFFPQQDTGIIVGLADASQDVSLKEMMRLQRQLTDIVDKDPAVAGWGTFIGGIRPINNGFLMINLKPRDERDADSTQIIARLRAQFAKVPGATFFLQSAQDLNVGGRLARTQYQYTLLGPDIAELNEWAPKLLEAMRKLPALRDIATDQQANSTSVQMVIDRDQAARFGIQPSLIDQTLYDSFGQRMITQYFTQLNTYRVILEVDPALQGDPKTLEKIYIRSPLTGQNVPLSSFVRYDTNKTSFLSINHQAQFPAVTLSFNLAEGYSLGQAVDAVNDAVYELRIPRSISGSFQGTAKAFESSLRSQPYLIAAALVAVYIILGVLYESYIHPLTILSTLPSAGVGALLMLLVFKFDLTVIALIGIILLIGIVKKNGIMMVDFAIGAEREEGLSPHDSIRKACLMRFRPIMMTTMAALLGAVPLMVGTGTGSELRQPLGYTMVGGLVLSQMLTLFTTPVIYLYLDRLHRRFAGRFRRSAAAH